MTAPLSVIKVIEARQRNTVSGTEVTYFIGLFAEIIVV